MNLISATDVSVMPDAPNTLSAGSGHNETNRTDERPNRLNFHRNFNFNDIYANVSEEQLEEITQTLHVNMVSDSMDNLSSRSSSSCAINNRDNNNQNINTLSETIVCGIVVVDERVAYNQNSNTITQPLKNCVILGSVVLSKTNYSCEELRRSIQTQLSNVLTDTNQKFIFLTKDGWPLARSQENKVNAFSIIGANNVITIRKTFDKPRFGIINANNDSFGFVFAEYFWSVRQLRDTIDDHFKELGLKNPKPEYTFIEKNGWPVVTNQEMILSVLDIIANQTICLQIGPLIQRLPNVLVSECSVNKPIEESKQIYTSLPSVKYKPNIEEISFNNTQKTLDVSQVDSMTTSNPRNKSKKQGFSVSIRRTTRKTNEKVVRIKSNGKSNGKCIMVSYARQEAAQHALNLKQELVERGFSVYLDVHEIQTGSDWMDSLNDAVRGCQVFVPLVTPMYGKTQWTNREVKLADLLRKYIIPINFLDMWPPECLAIQFATTQYIPWRPVDSDHESPLDRSIPDIKIWPEIYLKKVSNLITIQIKENLKSIVNNPEAPRPLMPATVEADGPNGNGEAEKSLIVISAHPQEIAIVQQIKESLEDEYQIWCSTDLPEGGLVEEDLLPKTPPFTPTQLPTIAEGKETTSQVFNDAYINIARNIVEQSNSRQQRPKSLPPNMNDTTVEPKRLLTRLTSHTSETSHLSSLTPEKMDRMKSFQDKVISAGVVIIVASETYYKSRTSKQHVYYCEQRKKTIVVRYDQTPTPPWFAMLMAQDPLSIKNPRFIELLKSRVKRTLDPSTKAPEDDMHESKMSFMIGFLKKNLPLLETCVYVVGSTKLQTPRSEEICKAIGSEMAKVKNIKVVTSGFYGAGDIVAKSFHDSRQNACPRESLNANSQFKYNESNANSFESSVVHIVPLKDSEDFSSKCRQSADGSFETVPYGKTMFLGESVKERESAVARLLDTCILIEGGPGSAHEIEEFIWNDHFIIPIISSGGAASGRYGVPSKIFDCPNGVSETDWNVLSQEDASPVDVAKAVVRIVVAIKEAIAHHALSKLQAPLKAKTKLMRKHSQVKKKLAASRKLPAISLTANSVMPMNDENDPNSPEKILPIIETTRQLMEKANIGSNKNNKWKQMRKMLTLSGKKC